MTTTASTVAPSSLKCPTCADLLRADNLAAAAYLKRQREVLSDPDHTPGPFGGHTLCPGEDAQADALRERLHAAGDAFHAHWDTCPDREPFMVIG